MQFLKYFLGFCTCCFLASACDAGSAPQKVFRFEAKLNVDGLERSYTLNLPANYYDAKEFPLIIAMHGGGGSAKQFESTNLLTAKANAAGFAVVYPNGTATGALPLQTWNGGGCCGSAVQNKIDDVNFIRQLIAELMGKYKLNPKRVYATGHSNGGIMSYRLACELSENIAAIAPNAAALMLDSCTPTRPVPVLHMHSKQDQNVPMAGGKGIGLAGVAFPPLMDSLSTWVNINACQNKTTSNANQYSHTVWSGCAAGANAELYLTEDGGHAWPGGLASSAMGDTPSVAINANDLLLEFFSRYQLP